jgi:hypothetical protein
MDLLVENHGTLFLLWPQSQAGGQWLREHTTKDAQWWGPGRGGLTRAALVVEPHYVADIVEGAVADGLE